jgi:hypothetical protein
MTEGFLRDAENSILFIPQLHAIRGDFPLIKKSLGDLCDSGTPGNIPNPVVKAVSADGTWRATSRESRSLPRGFFYLILLFSHRFS